jgi:uncharacterized YigZ family protein
VSARAYRTLAGPASAEVEDRRSRFLATVEPVPDEDAARALVERLRREHWGARHHCSAFVLGPDAAVQRSSDDGEPAGTAGAPMLEVLRGAGLSDVAAVVTRWFGGTLLGAGGLVRAYGAAVRAALAGAEVRDRRLVVEHRLVLDHARAGRVESELRSRGFRVLDADYTDRVTIGIGVPAGQEAGLAAAVAELTAGAVTPEPVGEHWVDA